MVADCKFCKNILLHSTLVMDHGLVRVEKMKCNRCGAEYEVTTKVTQTPAVSDEQLEKVFNKPREDKHAARK